MALHSYAAFVPVRWMAALLPRPVLHGLAVVMGSVAFAIMPRARRTIRQNLQRSVGHVRMRSVLRTFTNYARVMTDMAWMASASPRRLESIVRSSHGVDRLRETLAAGHGAIVVSAHVGNWELGGLLIAAAMPGRPMAAVALAAPGGRIVRFREDLRARFGIETIYLDSTAPFFIHAILKRNGIVFMLAERNYTPEGVQVPFLGEEVSFPSGPARVALATGAPILTAFCLLNPDGTTTAMIGPCAPSPGAADPVRDLTAQMAGSLEGIIRRTPEQWFNFFPPPPDDL